jgi:uncharacterized damage-inducible protein DinB
LRPARRRPRQPPRSREESSVSKTRRVVLVGALVSMAWGTARAAGAQSSTLNAELLKDWSEQKNLMMKIADAMPADKFSYKSTPAQRDYGQQILHVAAGNVMYLQFFGGKAPAPAINRTATDKAGILKALADSYDYGAALIREQTDQSMLQTVETNRYLGTSSRARVIYFLLGHTWDIYGQMAVYLRLNGLVPPASQRP